MTLVEISEREVLAAAKAYVTARKVMADLLHRKGRGSPEASEALQVAEKALFDALALLEKRERVAAQLAQGVIPPEHLIFSEELLVAQYPPMAEGQCHWEINGGEIVGATAICQHVAKNSVRNDEAKSGEAVFRTEYVADVVAEGRLSDLPLPRLGVASTSPESDTVEAIYDEPYTLAEERGETTRFPPQRAPTFYRRPRGLTVREAAIAAARLEYPDEVRFTPTGKDVRDLTRPRKLSRREQEVEKRRRSDPTGRDRSDIDYSSTEDPEVR